MAEFDPKNPHPEYTAWLQYLAGDLPYQKERDQATENEKTRALEREKLALERERIPPDTQIYNDLKRLFGPEQAEKLFEAYKNKSEIEKAKIVAATANKNAQIQADMYKALLGATSKENVAGITGEARTKAAALTAAGQLSRDLQLSPDDHQLLMQFLTSRAAGGPGGGAPATAGPGGAPAKAGAPPAPTGRLPLPAGPPARGAGFVPSALPAPPAGAVAATPVAQLTNTLMGTPAPTPAPFQYERNAQGIYQEAPQPRRPVAGPNLPQGYNPMSAWAQEMANLRDVLAARQQAGAGPSPAAPAPAPRFTPGMGAQPTKWGEVGDPTEAAAIAAAMQAGEVPFGTGGSVQDPDELRAILQARAALAHAFDTIGF